MVDLAMNSVGVQGGYVYSDEGQMRATDVRVWEGRQDVLCGTGSSSAGVCAVSRLTSLPQDGPVSKAFVTFRRIGSF
jgi:hypothetical protein